MISKETIYKITALWAIALIAMLLLGPLVAYRFPKEFWLYGEFMLAFALIGVFVFAHASNRPDIVRDLIDDEPQ